MTSAKLQDLDVLLIALLGVLVAIVIELVVEQPLGVHTRILSNPQSLGAA